MNEIKKKNNNVILNIIIAIGIIFNSGYALNTVYQHHHIIINILLSFILLIEIYLYYKKNKIDMYMLTFMFFTEIVIITYIVSGFSASYTYIYYLTSIIIGFGISIKYEFKKIVPIFLNTMVAISIVSLVGYFLVNNTSILSVLPIMKNKNDVLFGVGYIFYYIVTVPDRNCGIFWEPGLFATFLIISIVLELLFKNKNANWLKIILFTICIFTTKSAAGYRIAFINSIFTNNKKA